MKQKDVFVFYSLWGLFQPAIYFPQQNILLFITIKHIMCVQSFCHSRGESFAHFPSTTLSIIIIIHLIIGKYKACLKKEIYSFLIWYLSYKNYSIFRTWNDFSRFHHSNYSIPLIFKINKPNSLNWKAKSLRARMG